MLQVEHLAKLRYLEQILMESLRLWPTAAAFAVAPHETTTLAGKYRLTPDDVVMVVTPILHRDRTVWGEDVEEFVPERFEPARAEKLPRTRGSRSETAPGHVSVARSRCRKRTWCSQ